MNTLEQRQICLILKHLKKFLNTKCVWKNIYLSEFLFRNNHLSKKNTVFLKRKKISINNVYKRVWEQKINSNVHSNVASQLLVAFWTKQMVGHQSWYQGRTRVGCRTFAPTPFFLILIFFFNLCSSISGVLFLLL